MEEAERDIQSVLVPEADKVFRADTVEELANRIGVDPAALRIHSG